MPVIMCPSGTHRQVEVTVSGFLQAESAFLARFGLISGAVCRCLGGWEVIVKCPLFHITSVLRALVISDPSLQNLSLVLRTPGPVLDRACPSRRLPCCSLQSCGVRLPLQRPPRLTM